MKKFHSKGNDKGFTILELLIATTIFSAVLLICAAAIVSVGKIFYKGSTLNNTQDMARIIIDDISQAIQFAGNQGYARGSSGTKSWVCIGDLQYTFDKSKSRGTKTGQIRHVMWKNIDPSCNNLTNNVDLNLDLIVGANASSLVGNDMRIPALNVYKNISSGIWTVSVTVAYGEDNDVFVKNVDGTYDYTKCASNSRGGQYCAVSTVSTNVSSRL